MGIDQRKYLINQLFMLLKTAQIHDPGNRAFQHPVEQFHGLLETMIAEEGVLTLESIDMGIFLNETKIRSDISTFGTFRFIDNLFAQKDIGGIRIQEVPSLEELAFFVQTLSKDSAVGAETLNGLLQAKGFQSIELLMRQAKKTVAKEDIKSSVVNAKQRAMKNYIKAIDIMKGTTTKAITAQSSDTRKAKRVVYNLVDICMEEGFSFLGLSNIKNYDEYTFNHSVNVCVISIAFGKNLGLSKRQIGELGLAGLYHDFGKTRIPTKILNKPGRFNDDEWAIMKEHPLMAIKEMIGMKGGFEEIDIKKMIAAFEHHRNYDCSGYPQTGIKKELNFYSRVVAISDAYDAMTTNRVYQRGMLPTVALKILMDNAGTKFDPLLVKAFVHTVGIYPVGALVQLNDGSMAIVLQVPTNPEHMEFPTVKVVLDAQGQRHLAGPVINLANTQGTGSALSVVNLVRPEDHNINVAHSLFGDALEAAKKDAG